MIARVARVRIGLGMVLAVVASVGVVAVPQVALAAPWTISALSDGTTDVQLAAALVGPGVTVNSVDFTGDPSAAGLFNDTAASVGLAGGVVMSSGHISDVVGPNSASNTGDDLGQPGDAQLDAILPDGQETEDATSLTVDFTPTNPQLAINYVFASEEYEEYVGSEFNDVFAFYVNGVNCALTPGTNAPITINTVNQSANSLFYVPNESGTYDTEFDGFTVVLTCRAAVNPGVTNQLRLVIADVSDGDLDSGVFLQANGVSSNPIGPLQPITPDRLLDTREPVTGGASNGLPTETIVPGGTSISVKVTGGEVPDTALAVALNITAVDGEGAGFLTIFPDGGPQPGTSSVNFPPGAASPNTVVAKIGTGGRIRIFTNVSVQRDRRRLRLVRSGWHGPAVHGRARPGDGHPCRRGTGGHGSDARRPDHRYAPGAGRRDSGDPERHRCRRGRSGLLDSVPVGPRPAGGLERELRSGCPPTEQRDRTHRCRREDQDLRVQPDPRHRRCDGLVRVRRTSGVRGGFVRRACSTAACPRSAPPSCRLAERSTSPSSARSCRPTHVRWC